MVFQYALYEMNHLGGWYCAEAGRKNMDGDTGNRMEGGEGGAGTISVHNNRRRSLGPECSLSEVGTPPPHNLDKPHRLVTSIINNKNNNKNIWIIILNVPSFRNRFITLIIREKISSIRWETSGRAYPSKYWVSSISSISNKGPSSPSLLQTLLNLSSFYCNLWRFVFWDWEAHLIPEEHFICIVCCELVQSWVRRDFSLVDIFDRTHLIVKKIAKLRELWTRWLPAEFFWKFNPELAVTFFYSWVKFAKEFGR